MKGHSLLLVGASSYVGARLRGALEGEGHCVRCLPDDSCDASDSTSLRAAMRGVDTAYYLPHKESWRGRFQDRTRRDALDFAAAVRQAGLRRIIYLGGLSDGGKYTGRLCSPQEVADILRNSGATVVEFRTSLIVGPGSLAFEMLRTIVETLPAGAAPRWTRTPIRPIAVDDVVGYLVAALQSDDCANVAFDIGGADIVSVTDLLRDYARQRGLRRFLLPLPVNAPRLSILWLSLISPAYGRISQELVAALCHTPSLDNSRALETFPVRPIGIREAIARASESLLPACRGARAPAENTFGPRIVDCRSLHVARPPSLAFRPVERIGGKTGWYYADWLWRLRGWLDVLLGGVGLRPGRRDPEEISVGDRVDFWRVEAFERDRLLRLAGEMKLPGRAWLQFEVDPAKQGSMIRQTAVFDPIGLAGLLYWYILYPFHELIFPGMLRGIARAIPSSRGVEARRHGAVDGQEIEEVRP
jgi:uncharacterized protein YbjT (DUF2867 family)